MAQNAVKSAERRLLPPLNPEEQKILASALIKDAMKLFQGKAGATLAITDESGAYINSKSKPLEVVSFRIKQYTQCPSLFRYFLFRHEGELFDKLRVHYAETYPECMEV